MLLNSLRLLWEVYRMMLLDEKLKGSTKSLFLETLSNYPEGIGLEVVGTSRVFRGKMDNKPTIFVDVKVLESLPDCKVRVLDNEGNPIQNSDHSYKTTQVEAQDYVIGIDFKLKPIENNSPEVVYKVTPKTNLFSLLNFSLIEKGMISPDNDRGVGVSEEEIKEALEGTKFIGKSVRVTDTDYKPYFKLVVGGKYNE